MATDDRNEQGRDDRREETARRAYERFQERGGLHGDDQADWFEAERELNERSASEQPRGREPARPEDRREESATSGRAPRGRGGEGAPLNEETARTSGTGPTSTPPGTGPGGNVRTPGTSGSGGPTEPGR